MAWLLAAVVTAVVVLIAFGQKATASIFQANQVPTPQIPLAPQQWQTAADGKKRLALALFGALSVADVDGGRIVIAHGQGSANR